MGNHKISIIMGAYNCEDTINDAIDSILNQTYTDWEFIICDDASRDETYSILTEYNARFPDKFIILQNEKNSQLSFSLNRCLEFASGQYIARMDADDLSKDNRLQEQIDFLETHQHIDLVGTAMQRFSKDGLKDIVTLDKNPDKYAMRNGYPFNHATILTYKYVYDKLNGYTVTKNTSRAEDMELWFRFFASNFKGANLETPLYLVREDYEAIKRRTPMSRLQVIPLIMNGYKLLGFPKLWTAQTIFITTLKAFVPFKIQLSYRKSQEKKYKEEILEKKD